MAPRYLAPRSERIDLFLEIGRRLDAKGWVAANDGNLSVREPDGTFLVTASGAAKGHLRPNQILRVDGEGRRLAGEGRPSSELDLHLTIYRERPDVGAVVHAHPPVSTAFAVAREPLDACVLPELVLTLGRVPIAPYATPGTAELGASVVEAIRSHDAVLLANHGAVTVGPDLESAYFTMERVEHGSRILLYAHLLGRVTPLERAEVERLLATGPSYDRTNKYPHEPGQGRLPCVPAEDEVRSVVNPPERGDREGEGGGRADASAAARESSSARGGRIGDMGASSLPTSSELSSLIREVLSERRSGGTP